jgi:hypothetical protein
MLRAKCGVFHQRRSAQYRHVEIFVREFPKVVIAHLHLVSIALQLERKSNRLVALN